ncbi:MAG: flavin reductase family protein [Catalinimonas sp.]
MQNTHNAEERSKALQKITYGFHVLTSRKSAAELSTRTEDWLAAGTVSWVTQVSFEPQLVAVAVQKSADLNETIQKSQHFAVNVLGKDNRAMVEQFAGKTEVGDHTLDGHAFEDGLTTCPLLKEALAYIECELDEAVTLNGDHMLFIGRVVNAGVRQDAEPLVEWETEHHYGG